jgi:hypothetical protein
MGRKFIPYPPLYRVIPVGYSGFGYPLPSLVWSLEFILNIQLSTVAVVIMIKQQLSTVSYYTILYYTILYYTILYYTILYYTIIRIGLATDESYR